MEKSDFGSGLTYCIGLFLAHAERDMGEISSSLMYELWFNGASDHLYDLVIPKSLDPALKNDIQNFKDFCLSKGHSYKEPLATLVDKKWAIDEAKALLRRIDEAYGIKTIKGEWE